MSKFAPVLVFAYRRPDHLRNTLNSLMRCDGFIQSPVILYCDGPRNKDETNLVMATREVAKTMLGERATYHFSPVHLGLSCSVIAGVTDIVERFGRVIVVEDDLELSTSFLTFLNHALDHYAHDTRIFQISGYMFGVPELPNASSVFLPFIVSWGWATWKRAWDQFDPMASGWESLLTSRSLRRHFNLDEAYDYTTMLMRQMIGLIDSWAIRWYWTVFKANGLVLFPPVSLVYNAGLDGSGTHGIGFLGRFRHIKPLLPSLAIVLPNSVFVDFKVYSCVKKALWQQKGGWIRFILDRVRLSILILRLRLTRKKDPHGHRSATRPQ